MCNNQIRKKGTQIRLHLQCEWQKRFQLSTARSSSRATEPPFGHSSSNLLDQILSSNDTVTVSASTKTRARRTQKFHYSTRGDEGFRVWWRAGSEVETEAVRSSWHWVRQQLSIDFKSPNLFWTFGFVYMNTTCHYSNGGLGYQCVDIQIGPRSSRPLLESTRANSVSSSI